MQQNLDLYLSVERVQPKEFEYKFDDINVLLKFNHPLVNQESDISEEFIAALEVYDQSTCFRQLMDYILSILDLIR